MLFSAQRGGRNILQPFAPVSTKQCGSFTWTAGKLVFVSMREASRTGKVPAESRDTAQYAVMRAKLLPICLQSQTKTAPLKAVRLNYLMISMRRWLRGLDLNQRPSGYEPDELPDCSTPRHRSTSLETPKGLPSRISPLTYEWVSPRAFRKLQCLAATYSSMP